MFPREVKCRDGKCAVWSQEPVIQFLSEWSLEVQKRTSGLFFKVKNRHTFFSYCSWRKVGNRCMRLRSYRKSLKMIIAPSLRGFK